MAVQTFYFNPLESRSNSPVSFPVVDVSRKNYLQHCVERIQTSESDAKELDREAKYYKVTAVALLVISIAGTVAVLITVAFLAPSYLLFAVITSKYFLESVLNIFQERKTKGKNCENAAERIRAIAAEYHAIAHVYETPAANRAGVTIKPFLAHYNYWRKLYEKNKTSLNEVLEEARSEAPTERAPFYVKAQGLLQSTLVAKVSAAFHLAMMHYPTFKEYSTEFCSLKGFEVSIDTAGQKITSPLLEDSWACNALFLQFCDDDMDNLVVFKKCDKDELCNHKFSCTKAIYILAPLSIKEARVKSVSQIAERFLNVMLQRQIVIPKQTCVELGDAGVQVPRESVGNA